MPREICTLLLALVCAGVATTGCKQKSKEEAEPEVAPSASVAPSATAEAPPQPNTIPPPIVPPASPPVSTAKAGSGDSGKSGSGDSIKVCCEALHKEADSATPDKKTNLQSLAGTCDAIDKLVVSGHTKKAAALTQLRASLRGTTLPPGCN